MQITIDTKKDGKEEIKKLIGMLSALVDEPVQTNSTDVFEDNSSAGVNAFASMFGGSGETAPEPENQGSEGSVADKLKSKVEIVPY